MKILALTPSYNAEKVLPDFFKSLYDMSPQPYRHIFVTNNCTDKTNEVIDSYAEEYNIERISFELDREFNKYMKHDYAAIGLARQILLDEARRIMKEDKEVSHAIYLDDDIRIRTKFGLMNMVNWNKDILGGAYMRLFPEGSALGSKWLIDGKIYSYTGTRKPLDIPTVTSAGCLMLSRKAVLDNRLNFYPIHKPGFGIVSASEDFAYCLHARELGYQIWLDGLNIVEHLTDFSKMRPWIVKQNNDPVEFSFE